MHPPSLLYVGAVVGLVGASAPPPAAVTTTVTVGKVARAIIPTVSGQIGINPVSAGLGDPSDYVGPIGTDTNLYQVVQSTTKVPFFLMTVEISTNIMLVDWCKH